MLFSKIMSQIKRKSINYHVRRIVWCFSGLNIDVEKYLQRTLFRGLWLNIDVEKYLQRTLFCGLFVKVLQ